MHIICWNSLPLHFQCMSQPTNQFLQSISSSTIRILGKARLVVFCKFCLCWQYKVQHNLKTINYVRPSAFAFLLFLCGDFKRNILYFLCIKLLRTKEEKQRYTDSTKRYVMLLFVFVICVFSFIKLLVCTLYRNQDL